MKKLKDLNKIAAADDLFLVKGERYFYWTGTTVDMELKCAAMDTTAIYTCHFNQATFDYWLRELSLFKSRLIAAESNGDFDFDAAWNSNINIKAEDL